jgi:hypothetical protein
MLFRLSPNYIKRDWKKENKEKRREATNEVQSLLFIFMFAPYVSGIKILFIEPTDAHCYKIVDLLKHLKL